MGSVGAPHRFVAFGPPDRPPPRHWPLPIPTPAGTRRPRSGVYLFGGGKGRRALCALPFPGQLILEEGQMFRLMLKARLPESDDMEEDDVYLGSAPLPPPPSLVHLFSDPRILDDA